MARRAVTRREVLSQSAKLFALHGYHSTSLELVAKQLGVTRQALYYHFRSKSEILGALFDELMTKLETAAQTVSVSGPGEDPRFVRLLRSHIEVCLANLDRLALLLHERPATARLEWLKANKRRREYTDIFVEAYDEGVAAGSLRDVDTWIVVNTMLAAINSVSTWHRGSRTQGARDQFHDTLLTLLTHGHVISANSNSRLRT